jgi:glucokinase
VVDPAGPLCLCGKRGCVERLASGPYLVQQVREQLQQGEASSLHSDLAQCDLSQLTAQQVSQAAAQGDAVAQTALRQAGWAIGTAIGNVANLINPQRFILGGGVTQASDPFWPTLRQTARITALPEVEFEIEPAALGGDAPLWGALALAQSGWLSSV